MDLKNNQSSKKKIVNVKNTKKINKKNTINTSKNTGNKNIGDKNTNDKNTNDKNTKNTKNTIKNIPASNLKNSSLTVANKLQAFNNTFKNWVRPNKKEFPEWFSKTFLKFRATGKQESMKNTYEPYNYQKLLRAFMQNNSPYRGILLFHGLGTGKCHGKNTKILMYQGGVKNVQDIKVGEQLMGPNGTPRNVLSLASGQDNIYRIKYNNYSYTVNSEHILVLQHKDKLQDIQQITVNDYLNKDDEYKNNYYGFRKSNVFSKKEIPKLSYQNYQNVKDNFNPLFIYNSMDIQINFLLFLLNMEKKFYNNDKIILQIYTMNNYEKIIFLLNSCGIKYCFENIININDTNFMIPIQLQNLTLTSNLNKEFIITSDNLIFTDLSYPFEVNLTKEKDYYGFVLDSDHCYLLGDSSVTHNTCTSITIAENLKKERNIVVLLPASLKSNFIYKGLLFCGDPEYKKNESKIEQKYSFISYNAPNTLTQLKRLGSLDNKVIIIEEVHNLISIMISGIMGSSKQGMEIYNMLMNATNVKIIAMSGTPIINDAFEAGVLFNVLCGYNEVNFFRIIKVPAKIGVQQFKELEEELLNHKYVEYASINKINKSIKLLLNVKSFKASYSTVIEELATLINKKVEARFLELRKIPLFPIENEGEDFRRYFVDEDEKEGDTLKNEEIFRKRILGLVSHYSSKKGNYPKVIYKDYYRVEMSNYQFLIYEILRNKERQSERGSSSKNSKKKKKVKSTFRVYSRQSSNFVFPEEILRPYRDPKFIVSLKKNKKNNKIDEKTFNTLIENEERIDENSNAKMSADYKLRIDQAIEELDAKGDVYLRPGPEGLDKLSPKMKMMLENIQQSKGLVFIYSNFRSVEGVEIFSRILNHNGYAKFGSSMNVPKYAIYSGSEDEKMKKEILDTFTKEDNKDGKYIKIILATVAGAEGLDLKNIRQIHIIEPYWNQMRIQQVIGRGVRRDSHIALPPSERNIEIYRYFSVFSNKNALTTRDKLSTDEHIEEVSIKKQKIINQLLLILKECAFDCVLNSANINGDYPCFSFGKGAKGFSYYPEIGEDIIMSGSKNSKKVERKLVRGLYYNKQVYLFNPDKKEFYLVSSNKSNSVKIDLEKVKTILLYIDVDEKLVYDAKSVQQNNPIVIGKIKNNKIVKI